jgi:micrococcal nuclease
MKNYNVGNCSFVYKVLSVDHVVDGDTIDVLIDLGFDILTKQRIRLLGIDTPESRTSNLEEKKYGLYSKNKLISMLHGEIEIRCKLKDGRDKYGRVLGEVWVKDNEEEEWLNVNKWLCDNAYAVPYEGQNKENIEESHLLNRLILDTFFNINLK